MNYLAISILLLLAFLPIRFSYAAGPRVLELDRQVVADMGAARFQALLELVDAQGMDAVRILNKTARLSLVSEVNANYGAGDAYLMLGLRPEKDADMRRDEYQKLFPIVDYLARFNMRVTVNLRANTSDLRAALSSQRATLIIWSSHGNKTHFYGFDGEPIPHGIFKNTSKSTYQFILSSCDGRIALDSYYLKDISEGQSLHSISWTGTTTTADLVSYLMSDRWSVYIGRASYENQGLTCVEGKMIRQSDKKVLASFASQNRCGEAVMLARENFVCIQSEGGTSVYSISRGERLWGSTYSEAKYCTERLGRAFQKRVCRGGQGTDEFRIVDSVSGSVSSENYKSMRACEEALASSRSL